MKKVAIITLVLDNYGTKLQSYALCKVLNNICSNDLNVEVVNLERTWGGKGSTRSKKQLIIDVFKHYGSSIPMRLWEIFLWEVQKKKYYQNQDTPEIRQRTQNFKRINSQIPYTDKKYTFDEIRNGELPEYDGYIVGSDQVWNGIKVGNQDVFMLDFVKKGKCLTYAASFGMTHIPDMMMIDYQRRIKNFESLLIREEEGVRLCEKLGCENVHQVLDPTLLLDKHGYEEIIYSKPVVEGDFVLVYSLNNSLKIHNEAYKLAKTTHSKLVILKTKPCPPNISVYNDCIEIYTAASEEFLWLISHAKCVITNSYHAMLFSINYGADFYLYLDNADEENSRMLSTANLCGLKDRVYWMTDSLPNEIIEIDYTQTNEILLKEREKSINLLKESLISSNLI